MELMIQWEDNMAGHLAEAAKFARRKNNVNYYCYHAWIAFRASAELVYVGIMSFIHGIFPFIYPGFGLAKIIVKSTNKIRQSIPDWEGWQDLDKWENKEYK